MESSLARSSSISGGKANGPGVKAMANIILETRGLTKHYGGVHALEDANFVLHEGEHVAVVGDNGAGKSTFVRQVTAVEQRSAGEVFFEGQPVNFSGPLETREAGIETVFQTLALADDLDVLQTCLWGASCSNSASARFPGSTAKRCATARLRRFGPRL